MTGLVAAVLLTGTLTLVLLIDSIIHDPDDDDGDDDTDVWCPDEQPV